MANGWSLLGGFIPLYKDAVSLFSTPTNRAMHMPKDKTGRIKLNKQEAEKRKLNLERVEAIRKRASNKLSIQSIKINNNCLN